MSDLAELWHRIEAARKRLGTADEAQVKQIQDINSRVKEIRAGLSGRVRELERQHEEVTKLRHDNEQLRRMLHRLLLAIEQGPGGGLKSVLIKDLAAEVGALAPLAAKLHEKAARPVEPRGAVRPAEATPKPPVELAPGPAAEFPTGPSETDSRWLHEIMERARELTGEARRPARPGSGFQGSRTAAA